MRSKSLSVSNVARRKTTRCSSPAAMLYWFVTSLIAWGILGVARIHWYPLHWYSASTILFAMGIGCVANWLRNRSFHCAITAPLFLTAAILFLLSDRTMARVNDGLMWALLFVGTSAAFLLEWRHARHSSCKDSE